MGIYLISVRRIFYIITINWFKYSKNIRPCGRLRRLYQQRISPADRLLLEQQRHRAVYLHHRFCIFTTRDGLYQQLHRQHGVSRKPVPSGQRTAADGSEPGIQRDEL